ncbi:MAG TPA: ATPase domain-containing protein [Steroidobacteraceae bacterium]|nr:ATPase domain-containing protein [Steroidobacteraceae bacterium]
MNQNMQRSKTGIFGLDEVLNGGFISQQLYLVDGVPGAGKTTLALQYLLEGAQGGERCTYVTLSETKQELEAGALSHGWSLGGIDIVELIADEEELRSEEQLTMLPASEVELGETTRKVLEAIERSRPSRVVIDSLSEYRLLAQSSLRYRRQILALKQFFIGRLCTVLMIDDRTSEGSDLQLHSLAHGVIALDSKIPAYGQIRRELHVVKFRGSDFISGFHDFAIRRGGLTVYPRLVAAQHTSSFQREFIPSGVTALDTLMGGGIDRGTSTLLIGPPGSGKSTLALQYATAATERGDHAATFVFDETKSALLSRSVGIGMQVNEGLGAGEIAICQIDPVAVSPGEFAHLVRSSVERDRARVVIIDSLNGYLNAMPQNNYLTAQLHELLSYLNNHGVATFFTVAQSGIIGANMTSPVDASYLADSVVLLRYFELAGTVRKAISVLKKRTGGHEGSIRELWFDKLGIHLSEPLLQLRGVLTGGPIEVEHADEHKRRIQPGDHVT